jgi:hypothetical protein
MATDLTTVFLPLVDEAHMAAHPSSELALHAHTVDTGLDVTFAETTGIDPAVFMIAPGEVFCVLAGTTKTFAAGPTVTAPADRHVLLFHIVTTYEWAPILAPSGQPVAEWWAVEGIALDSFETFLDGADLATIGGGRGYASGEDYRLAIVGGLASFNVLLGDKAAAPVATLDAPVNGARTLGLRAWATFATGLLELDAGTAIATFAQLAPSLTAHPLLVAVSSDVSTRDVTIHVRFVCWTPNAASADETSKGQSVPVPVNSKISLRKRSAAGAYTSIVDAVVAANGQVALVAPRAALNAVNLAAGERLAFHLEVPAGSPFTPQYQHNQTPRGPAAGLTWSSTPDTWGTDGRSTIDEAIVNLDFLVNYANAVVGLSAQPIEYYAGLPVFLQITYPTVYTTGAGAAAKFATQMRKAPKGLVVEIRDAATPPAQPALATFRTDEHGQVWGVVLTGSDGLAAPIEVIVKYEIEDTGIGLLKIEGDVVEGGNPPVSSYSSKANPINSVTFAAPIKSSIGKPTGAGVATGLAPLQVGSVAIGTGAVSDFTSVDGRHAGVVHALQQLRYVHQWFHYLTDGFTFASNDESWSGILARSNGAAGTWPSAPTAADQNYTIALPVVRVTEPLPGAAEDRFGEADLDELAGSGGQKQRRWRLTLRGHTHFTMNSTLAGVPVALPNKEQFWRCHTIWHEWTHAVVNVVLERLKNFDNNTYMTYNKNDTTSGRVPGVIVDDFDPRVGGFRMSGGWSTLEEGLAAIPEAALRETCSGFTPVYDPSDTAAPRFLVVDIDAAGNQDGVVTRGADLDLNQGLQVNLNLKIVGAPPLNDQRLGLRVPLAFTFGLWTALRQVGRFNETLEARVTGAHLNDLKDAVAYLSSAKAKRVFQALVWGPLVASRTPDVPGSPPQWHDLTVDAFGPTTFSFMHAIQTKFWTTPAGADRTAVKKLLGKADSPLSFYVWFSFP